MDNENLSPTERIRRLEQRFEQIIKTNRCEDREVQEALLRVAQDHLWRAGLWARLRWAINVIGALGIIGGGVMAALHFLGWDVVRR